MTLYCSGYSESRNIHWPNSFEGRQPSRVAVFKKTIPTAIPHSMRSMPRAVDAAMARNIRKAAQAAP